MTGLASPILNVCRVCITSTYCLVVGGSAVEYLGISCLWRHWWTRKSHECGSQGFSWKELAWLSTGEFTECGQQVCEDLVDTVANNADGGIGDSKAPVEGSMPPQSFDAKTILSLALPALGALVIEPLLTLIDSVMVGHLGNAPLAGLSLASTILMTLVGVFIFLAYSTTSVAARALGAGRRADAIRGGIEAMWLALGLGILLVVILLLTAPWIVSALGASGEVAIQAVTYLRSASFGMAGMLVILAATGTLRGLLDMRTPLYVLAAGSILNVLMNLLLIFGLDLGIFGAGIGLSITQTLMAIALVAKVIQGAGKHQVRLLPSGSGVLGAAGEGAPLFIRTLSLRLALLATVTVATAAGTLALAGHQVVNSIWSVTAFALDALAIAAQSLVGVALGSRHTNHLRAMVRRLSIWGVVGAAAIGMIVALLSSVLPVMFGGDPAMHQVAARALLAAGILMPISGLVFVLDGVLIGAGEGRYLAVTGVITLAMYLPTLIALYVWIHKHAELSQWQQATALTWLWVAFAGWFMLVRAITNSYRAYSRKLGLRTLQSTAAM